jgi:glycosyltransferase involved in cell wall biosynthesis
MPGFFAHADALLVTLRKEPIFAMTIPTKVQAYLASGKPIVAALDGEGARIITQAGAGIAAPSGDPEALAQAVLALYGMSPHERAAIGARALDYSRSHFDRATLIDILVAEMREAITEMQTARPAQG